MDNRCTAIIVLGAVTMEKARSVIICISIIMIISVIKVRMNSVIKLKKKTVLFFFFFFFFFFFVMATFSNQAIKPQSVIK